MGTHQEFSARQGGRLRCDGKGQLNLIGYKNKTNFRKIAEKLKLKNLIDITSNNICKLSPLGQNEAERIIYLK